MGAFELESECCNNNTKRFNEECVIALKIYDQCRSQICLTPNMLGPARAAENTVCCCEPIKEGDIIVPPANTASVTLCDLTLSRICITNKTPSPFRPGYWDIETKFNFTYNLIFKTADCCTICIVRAKSSYTTKLSLFGSIGTDVVSVTDFVPAGPNTSNSGPYVTVEAKAVALATELNYANNACDNNCGCGCGCCCCDCNCGCNNNCGCGCDNNCGCNAVSDETTTLPPSSVAVTIGLFAVTKVFRFVNLLVHSSGKCVPEDCSAVSGVTTSNPCDFFDNLEFPLNIFSPPDSGEFLGTIQKDSASCKCCNK